MKTVPMLLMRLLPTTVTLGFLWLVTIQGHVLEMVIALLVLLINCLQLVNVSAHFVLTLITFHRSHSTSRGQLINNGGDSIIIVHVTI